MLFYCFSYCFDVYEGQGRNCSLCCFRVVSTCFPAFLCKFWGAVSHHTCIDEVFTYVLPVGGSVTSAHRLLIQKVSVGSGNVVYGVYNKVASLASIKFQTYCLLLTIS